MKEWSINYSVRFKDGKIREELTSVEADDIQAALDEAERTLESMACENPDIAQMVIWDVGIITSTEDKPEEVF